MVVVSYLLSSVVRLFYDEKLPLLGYYYISYLVLLNVVNVILLWSGCKWFSIDLDAQDRRSLVNT